MDITRDELIKEFLEKGISPTLDASDWKQRPTELSDLAVHAKLYKVHIIVENSGLFL